MRKTVVLAALLAAAVSSHPAVAKDEILRMPIADAMSTDDAKAKLDGSVRFQFGKKKGGGKSLGSFTANRKTNFVGKSNEAGCQRAFLSAMIALQERAQKEGGNAVVGIHSVYRDENLESDTEYICGAGNVMGGVALRGEVVKN